MRKGKVEEVFWRNWEIQPVIARRIMFSSELSAEHAPYALCLRIPTRCFHQFFSVTGLIRRIFIVLITYYCRSE